jgi:uncharacterized protein (UPF0276 family)
MESSMLRLPVNVFMTEAFPYLGHGIGLRREHFSDFLDSDFLSGRPKVDWLEVISENFMWQGGRPRAVLEHVRRDYPIALHGVSLSIGSSEPPSAAYLQELKALASWVQPAWISDHLCWGTLGGNYAHDLLPLPFTEEAIAVVTSHVQIVQDVLQRPLVLENVSSYLAFAEAQMPEWQFLSAIAERSGCGILLDVNNVYVSAKNHGFAALDFIHGLPRDRVVQLHLAGHEDRGAYLFDSHDHPIADPVWALYQETVRHYGRVSTLIERDDHIPPLAEVIAESDKARTLEAEVVRA